MATQGESLIKKTQKRLSILAFETTKQSRILKKRMRIAALQKETKADLRDLGSLVYSAITTDQPGILEEEEVKILVESIGVNKAEVERLRDAIARLSRARKHFVEEEVDEEPAEHAAEPVPQAEPTLETKPSAAAPQPSPEDEAEPKPQETFSPSPAAVETGVKETPEEGELEVEITTAPGPALGLEEESPEAPEEKPEQKPETPEPPGAEPKRPEQAASTPEKLAE